MAVTLTLALLFKNGYWLKTSPDELYKLALSVAKSEASDKDGQLLALQATFAAYAYKHNNQAESSS